MKYEAVTAEQLVNRLGTGCSPMRNKDGYVIGPDINGRLCHCSTHDTLQSAQKKADELNETSN